MAVIKNITTDVLHLFHADAPPIDAGDEVTVSDERFVDRAWPKSTWELVEPPILAGYIDRSLEDAYVYVEGEPDPEPVALAKPAKPATKPSGGSTS